MAPNSRSIGQIERSQCHKLAYTDGKVVILPIIKHSKEEFG